MKSRTDTVKCGTCDYWTGERKPCFDQKSTPKVDILSGTGECENSYSRFFEQDRKQGAKCKDYSKWTELF